ncbi:hypothetical protein C8R47DRAFT_198115 [Mycena vitilis]|nr:hypothetical protein C8R47DRAFT_198115 [Mycena vitilis]
MDTRKLGQAVSVFETDDPPYPTTDDDPFNIKPRLLQPRRRRSSMLNKWIKEQQQVPTDVVDVEEGPSLPLSGTRSNPYLAYPELGTPTFNESVASWNSYDLMEDDDIPPDNEIPETPITTTPSRRGSKLLHTPSSFRSFHIPFRSSSPAGSLANSSATSRTPTLSLFSSRAPRSSTGSAHVQHSRSSSLSSPNILGESSSTPSSATKSKWRPSVLGHFGTSASQTSVVPSETLHTRSRPSISSNHTYTTTLTTTDSDMPITPPRSSATESVRARSRSYGSMLKLADNASSFSLWSGPSYLDELGEFSRSPSRPTHATSTMSCDGYIGMPPRVPLGPKPGSRLATSNTNTEASGSKPPKQGNRQLPEVAFSSEIKSRTLPRVSFASLGTRKRKKRLVISGIAAGDTRKFEAAKRWCESFGEVSQITRMPNDDLHVHFRNADVADTVCRLRATVYIRAVGSVQLSWYVANGTENSR